MTILITGADGFVGGHLVDYLLKDASDELVGTTFLPKENYPHLNKPGITLRHIDLRNEQSIQSILSEIKPRHIYHLAAQSFIPQSFRDPWDTLENNIKIQLNLLEGMKTLNLPSRMLVVGSSDVYGPINEEDIPISESQPFKPANPYSVSKVTQDMLGLQYHLSYGIDVIRVRPFSQFGPGQSKRFVAPAFASQIAEIENGKKDPIVSVGNLNARRDFTDVRDMVRAYRMAMDLTESGQVFNIGSGIAWSIQKLLDTLRNFSEKEIDVVIDPERLRPVEVPILQCDPSFFKSTTNWEPEYSFETSLLDILNEWRNKTAS